MRKKFKRADAIYNSGPLALMNAGLVEQEVDGGDARDRPPVRPRHVVDVPWRDVSDRPLDRVEMEMSLRYRSRFPSHYDDEYLISQVVLFHPVVNSAKTGVSCLPEINAPVASINT